MTYKDLVFSKIVSGPEGDVLQAIVKFENGLGLSILTGPGTLTTPERPFEAAVITFSADGTFSIIYPDFTHNDVLSYLTGDQVSDYMVKVREVKVKQSTVEIDNHNIIISIVDVSKNSPCQL